MKVTRQEFYEAIRKERRRAAVMMFITGMMGMVVGRCSNPVENRNVKSGVVSSDSPKSFQPGDTIKVILINEKQR